MAVGGPHTGYFASIAALVALGVLHSPLLAADSGDDRVLVFDFEGPDANNLRPRVVAKVNEGHALIPNARYRVVSDALGESEEQDLEILERIGATIDVDAYVQGEVEVRPSARTLVLTVRNGTNGEITREIRLPLTLQGDYTPDERPRRAFNQALLPGLASAIEDAERLREDREEDIPHLEVEEPDELGAGGSDAGGGGFEDFDEFDDMGDPGTQGEDGEFTTGAAPGSFGAAVSASMRALGRAFTLEGPPDVGEIEESRSNHVEVHADAEAFPFLHVNDSAFWRTLGFYGEVGYGVNEDDRMTLGAGLRYRTMVDDAPGSVSFHVSLGMARVATSTSSDEALPDLRYDAVTADAGARVPLVSAIRATLDVRYLDLLSTGDLGQEQNFGDSDSAGLVLDGGLEYAPTESFDIRIGARLTRFNHRFDAPAGGSERDRRPPVVAADDVSLGGYMLTRINL